VFRQLVFENQCLSCNEEKDPMETRAGLPRELQIILTVAGIVVIVAGMRAAASILIPILLSILIAVVCTPPLLWMNKKKVPKIVAVTLIMFFLIGIGYLLVVIIGGYISSFTESLSNYEEQITEGIVGIVTFLEGYGVDFSEDAIKEHVNVGSILEMIARVLAGFGAALTSLALILIIVFFILIEVPGMRKKVQVSIKEPDESLDGIDQFTRSVKRYLFIQTLTSMLTGILIGVWLWVLGVSYAPLWGLLAFLLNYVPKIGSLAASIPPILIAAVQLGLFHAVWTAVGFIVVNLLVGNLLEPKVMGRGLGMSAVVIFVALMFWGWVLGPIGYILAMPLTMMLKIALEHHENTRWIGLMLDDEPEGRLRELEGKNHG
jgi:AI-2 transport protein TqsA